MSKGGFKAFRGSSATATSYLLERDSKRLDDYYDEGADRTIQHGVVGDAGADMGTLSSEQFRAWMEHTDPFTGETRGSFRQRTSIDREGNKTVGGTPLYQETLISSSKSLSIAAASNPRIAEALERAMERATIAGAEALKEHAVTRVGKRGEQRQVKPEAIEFTSIQHMTSRSGDPHCHRHMQISPKVWAAGKWRALDGAVLYRLSERVHAAADLAMSTDIELRQAIADEGLTWEPGEGGGNITEYLPFVDEFSTRRDQIAEKRETLEAQWRIAHPGVEPGPKQLQAWDQFGWAQDRPEKQKDSSVKAIEPADLSARIPAVAQGNPAREVKQQSADEVSHEAIARGALDDVAQQRSAWSRADLKAAIDRRIATSYLVGETGVAELRAAALVVAETELVNLYDEGVEIEGSRHYTSKAVQATEQAIESGLTSRAQRPGRDGQITADRGGFSLTDGQVAAGQAIAGDHGLVVIEGAAGTGKTTMLQAANEQIVKDGRRIVAVSPTKRGALEMGDAIGAEGDSVHSLLVRAGANFDDNGKWTFPTEWKPQRPEHQMDKDTVLVVDEAGMLDQETAAALHKYADDRGVGTLVLLGDTKQLPAVGRGGYLANAARLATQAHDLRDVQRFKTSEKKIDQVYADASLKLREGQDTEGFFDLLSSRGQVRTGTSAEVIDRVAETVALELEADKSSIAIASTNATAQRINHQVYDHLVRAKVIDPTRTVEGRDGDPIAAGARVATRQNDREMQVANRQVWTVKRVNEDGRVIVRDDEGHHSTLEADYVRDHLQLAYAVTAHGSQGMTVDTAHTVVSDQMDAAGAYVGLTRGRYANVLHAVAVDEQDAREQFLEATRRASHDRGVHGAQQQIQRDVDGLDVSVLKPGPEQGGGSQRAVLEPAGGPKPELGQTNGFQRRRCMSRPQAEVEAPRESFDEQLKSLQAEIEASRVETQPAPVETQEAQESVGAAPSEQTPIETPTMPQRATQTSVETAPAVEERRAVEEQEKTTSVQKPEATPEPRQHRRVSFKNQRQQALKGVEVLAFVDRVNPDGTAVADLQLSANDPRAKGQVGLHLHTDRVTIQDQQGREEKVTNFGQRLSAAQYQEIRRAAGENRIEVNGREVLAVRGNLMPSTRVGSGSSYTVNTKSVKPSQQPAIGPDVLNRQRESEDKARAAQQARVASAKQMMGSNISMNRTKTQQKDRDHGFGM